MANNVEHYRVQEIFKFILVTAVLLVSSCRKEYLPGFDFASFDNTPAEELAYAVENNDPFQIVKAIESDPQSLNYREPEFGHSLLFLAVANNKYEAARTLLEQGCEISYRSYTDSSDVLMVLSTGYYNSTCDTQMLNLLVSYGASLSTYDYDTQGKKIGALRRAVGSNKCFLFVDRLIECGADINFRPNGDAEDSPVVAALMQDRLDMARYLLIERKAQVPEFCFIRSEATGPDSITVTRLLNEQDYSDNKQQQKRKEEILEFLKTIDKE